MADVDASYAYFSSEIDCYFQGDDLKKLKIMLCDHISNMILKDANTNATKLFIELAKHSKKTKNRPIASSTELKMFADIAKVTKLYAFNVRLTKFSKGKPFSLHKGTGLKPHRRILFEGIEECDTKKDFYQALAFYIHYSNKAFEDIWDLVLHLEVNDRLVTRRDLNRFADCLSGKAKGIIKDGLKDLVIQTDADIVRKEEDKLADLIPVQQDKESEIKEEIERIHELPFVTVDYPVLQQDTYGMISSTKRGICLIMNNIKFTAESKLSQRPGSEVDQAYLERVFKALGFEIKVETNLTGQEMKNVMENMSKEDHSKYDCFVCCILTHGKLREVAGADGKTCNILQLADSLRADKCESLNTKPKVFFIQACRKDTHNKEDDRPPPFEKHHFGDFLFGYSTAPMTTAYRNGIFGSNYISSLAINLEEFHNTKHIGDILTYVANEVGTITKFREVPYFESGLLKLLYFRPTKNVQTG